MSRTYRRKKNTNHAEKFRFCNYEYDFQWVNCRPVRSEAIHDTQSEYYQKQNTKYHTDGFWTLGSVRKWIKEDSNEFIRANERMQISKIYRLDDYEDADFDRSADLLVKHLWWVYL